MGEFYSLRHGLVRVEERRSNGDDGWVVGGDVRTDYTNETDLLRGIKDCNISVSAVRALLAESSLMLSYCVLPPTRAIGIEPWSCPMLFMRLYENLFG